MIDFFPSTRVFVSVFGFDIMWYAVIIGVGMVLAYILIYKNLIKIGASPKLIDDLTFGAIICGFIGARLWYVAFSDLGAYLSDPISIIMMREGGMAIQGGLVFGIGYGYYFARKHKLDFLLWADAIVPNIFIAQAIGRWGNFVNQEAYGVSVPESFFNLYPSFIKEQMFIGGEYHMPTFLFESIANIIGWALIVFVIKKMKNYRKGDATYAYLMWYGVIRFFIEGLRTDSLMFMGLRMAQLTSLVFILIGVLGYTGIFRKLFVKEHPDLLPVVLFDFDGTLMDTQQSIFDSFIYVFKELKPEYELSDVELLSFVGPTLHDSFGKHFPKEEVEKCVQMYREHNHELQKTEVFPFDGAEALIDNLSAKGYPLGLVSSKMKSVILVGMSNSTMKDKFQIILGSDNVENHKPDPEGILKAAQEIAPGHQNIVYVGDTPTDIQAGRNAEAFTIAYLSNPKRKEALEKEKPNKLITNLLDIEEILEENF